MNLVVLVILLTILPAQIYTSGDLSGVADVAENAYYTEVSAPTWLRMGVTTNLTDSPLVEYLKQEGGFPTGLPPLEARQHPQ